MRQPRLQRSLRATLRGLAVKVVLAGSKMVPGILGNSHALIADAVESIADVFSALIVWRALVIANEPADEDHPYGHGKAKPLARVFVAVLLIAAAGGIMPPKSPWFEPKLRDAMFCHMI